MYSMALDNSWLIMNEEEMYDVNGGKQLAYIPNSTIEIIALSMGINTLGTALLAIGYAKLVAIVSAKASLLGAKLGSLGGPIGAAVGIVLGLGGAFFFVRPFVDALLQGRGIAINAKELWNSGIYYGISLGVK